MYKLLRGLCRHPVPVAIYWIYDHALSASGGEHLGNIWLPQSIKRHIRERDLVVVRAITVLIVALELERSFERSWAVEELPKSEEAIARSAYQAISGAIVIAYAAAKAASSPRA